MAGNYRENRNAVIRANGGRIAGDGIISDDYSEESGNRHRRNYGAMVRFPNDNRDPRSLNGPVIIVQEGRKKDG